MRIPWVAAAILPISALAATKLDVTVIDRQDSESGYSYIVPATAMASSTADASCSGTAANVNCSGSSRTSTTGTPVLVGSYSVRGATLSLRLPDGRVAVVNCESKANHTEWTGNAIRSCRIPSTDRLKAEFNGEKAKLTWTVGIDDKKTQSETYRIVAVLGRP